MFLIIGASLGCLAVAAGAFGAHSLKGSLTQEMLVVFETAVRYQMYHALALCVTGWATRQFDHKSFRLAGWLFLSGIVVFSGSLYVLALTGVRWLGALTPLGGLAFMAGWGLLAWGFWKARGG